MSKKIWNINTTMRNPERLFNFLKVLKKLEGLPFDRSVQAQYQKELIRHKYYQPTNLPLDLKLAYDEPGDFNEDETEKIFEFVKKPDQRGRTSASRLNQMGLAIAKKTKGKVVITDLGNKLLNEEITIDEFFLKYFLKWQLPNKLERGYDDFDVSPFMATLYIINKVNEFEIRRNNKPKGISKDEFMLFCLQLKKHTDIPDVINEIISYRDELIASDDKNEFFNISLKNKASYLFNPTSPSDLETKCSTMRDYADSIIRWFRMTKLIYYRGGGRYIDIAPSRVAEVKRLLDVIKLNSIDFETEEEYTNYLIDLNKPELPWENVDSIKEIIKNLYNLIEDMQNKIDTEFPNRRRHSFETNPRLNITDFNHLKNIEKALRLNLEKLNNEYRTLKESESLNLDKYSDSLIELQNIKRSSRKSSDAPLCLEWYTARSLMAVDDAIEIRPNYVKGDDGLPMFTAPGGGADIECYYESFNLVVEVTLMRGRNQVNNEIQPLLRHYKDFVENLRVKKKVYALFIAPMFHRDVLNQSDYYISRGYEGYNDINIVFLTIEQFSKMLKIVKSNHDLGKSCSYLKLEELFDECVEVTKNEISLDWVEKIDESLERWNMSFR